MFLNRSARGHTGLKIKEIFGQKQFSIQSQVGLFFFLFNPGSFVSFSTLFIFVGGFFFRGMLVSTIFQKKKFSFLGLFRFMAPDFFCFCFSAAKVSNGRLLLYFLCSDLVLFAHLIESSIIFRRPGKKNSAAHRFRRRRRRCRHRRHHRGRKPFSAETATGTFPELSRLKNRKMKRLH